MALDPYTIKLRELQNHLRCLEHPPNFCYKPHANSKAIDHVRMDPKALADWTTVIINNPENATINNPPRGEEWDILLNPKARRKNAIESIPSSASGYQQPIFNVHIPSHSHSPAHSHSYYSRTPTRPHAPPVFSSPLVEHESWDIYGGDGLKAFITWCEREYKIKPENIEFQEAYQSMRAVGINVDVLKGKDALWFTSQGVKPGTAERLARSYHKWYSKLLR